MQQPDDLFQLIHSLTPSEKRYFKIHAAKQTTDTRNGYEKLFDALDALPAEDGYDEVQFKKALKGKSYGKNLPSEKNYLQGLIMQAMRAYRAEHSREVTLNNLLTDIRFLFEKGLPHAGKRIIDKAVEIAGETENLPVLLTLYNYKQRYLNLANVKPHLPTAAKEQQEEADILQLLNAERQTTHLRQKTYTLYTAGKLKPEIPALRKSVDDLIKLTAQLPRVTFLTTSNLLTTQALIAEKEGDFKSGMKHYEELLNLWQANPKKLYEPTAYIRNILGNYLVCAFYCERLDVFPAVIAQIEQLPVETARDEVAVFLQAKDKRLLYLLNNLDAKASEHLVTEIEAGLRKHKKMLLPADVIRFRMNMALLFLQLRQFDTLLDEINKIYTLAGRDAKYETQIHHLRIYELMANYSLKHFKQLEYQLQSMERWLREHQLNNDFIKQLLKTFRLLMQGEKPQKLSGQLTEVSCPPENAMIKELVLGWLNFLISGTVR